MIFKTVQEGRPYPAHDMSLRDWSRVPPRQIRLDQLITTKRVLALDVLLDDECTFYGDLFPHVVRWNGEFYLEDGLHRALRAALQHRSTLHVRVLDLDHPDATAPPGQPSQQAWDAEPTGAVMRAGADW